MNTKNAIVLERTTLVCKIVDDNADGTNDGGPFKFDIYYGAQFRSSSPSPRTKAMARTASARHSLCRSTSSSA